MTKAELLEKVIAKGLDASDATMAVDAFWDIVTEGLATNDKITIVHGDRKITAQYSKRSLWDRFWLKFDGIFA